MKAIAQVRGQMEKSFGMAAPRIYPLLVENARGDIALLVHWSESMTTTEADAVMISGKHIDVFVSRLNLDYWRPLTKGRVVEMWNVD